MAYVRTYLLRLASGTLRFKDYMLNLLCMLPIVSSTLKINIKISSCSQIFGNQSELLINRFGVLLKSDINKQALPQ
jgi:hypothetical protein